MDSSSPCSSEIQVNTTLLKYVFVFLDARYIQIRHYIGLILHVGPTQNVQKNQHENTPNRFIDSISNYIPKYNDM